MRTFCVLLFTFATSVLLVSACPPGPPGICLPCHNGTNGINGINGRNGTDGVCTGHCVNGTQGPAGPQGPRGFNGTQGEQGPRGYNGTNGISPSLNPLLTSIVPNIANTLNLGSVVDPFGNTYTQNLTVSKTLSSSGTLTVNGKLKIPTGATAGYVLTSASDGTASWAATSTPSSLSSLTLTGSGTSLTVDSTTHAISGGGAVAVHGGLSVEENLWADCTSSNSLICNTLFSAGLIWGYPYSYGLTAAVGYDRTVTPSIPITFTSNSTADYTFMRSGLVIWNGPAGFIQLPTATAVAQGAGLSASQPVFDGTCFKMEVFNIGTGEVLLTGNTGLTLIKPITIPVGQHTDVWFCYPINLSPQFNAFNVYAASPPGLISGSSGPSLNPLTTSIVPAATSTTLTLGSTTNPFSKVYTGQAIVSKNLTIAGAIVPNNAVNTVQIDGDLQVGGASSVITNGFGFRAFTNGDISVRSIAWQIPSAHGSSTTISSRTAYFFIDATEVVSLSGLQATDICLAYPGEGYDVYVSGGNLYLDELVLLTSSGFSSTTTPALQMFYSGASCSLGRAPAMSSGDEIPYTTWQPGSRGIFARPAAGFNIGVSLNANCGLCLNLATGATITNPSGGVGFSGYIKYTEVSQWPF